MDEEEDVYYPPIPPPSPSALDLSFLGVGSEEEGEWAAAAGASPPPPPPPPPPKAREEGAGAPLPEVDDALLQHLLDEVGFGDIFDDAPPAAAVPRPPSSTPPPPSVLSGTSRPPEVPLERLPSVMEAASVKARDFDQEMAHALHDTRLFPAQDPLVAALSPSPVNIATMTIMVNLKQDNINLTKLAGQMDKPHVLEALRRCGIDPQSVNVRFPTPPSSLPTPAAAAGGGGGEGAEDSGGEDDAKEKETAGERGSSSSGGGGVQHQHHRRRRRCVDLMSYFEVLDLTPQASQADVYRRHGELSVELQREVQECKERAQAARAAAAAAAKKRQKKRRVEKDGEGKGEEGEDTEERAALSEASAADRRAHDAWLKRQNVDVALRMLRHQDFQNAVILKYNDRGEGRNNKAVKFFCNGTLHVTGPKSTQECLRVAHIACQILNATHRVHDPAVGRMPFVVSDFNVQLINTNFSVAHRFRLPALQQALARRYGRDSSFDPQMHAGLNVKVPVYHRLRRSSPGDSSMHRATGGGPSAAAPPGGGVHSVVVLVFDSGHVIITRVGQGNDLREAHRFIASFLASCVGTSAVLPPSIKPPLPPSKAAAPAGDGGGSSVDDGQNNKKKRRREEEEAEEREATAPKTRGARRRREQGGGGKVRRMRYNNYIVIK